MSRHFGGHIARGRSRVLVRWIRRTRPVAACRTSSKRKPASMRARSLGVGEYCEEERPCLQLHSSTGSSSPSCVHLAAGVHPTAYSPRRRPLRASRDESRKSEHDTRCGLNAATRDMAALAEAARCAASKIVSGQKVGHITRVRQPRLLHAVHHKGQPLLLPVLEWHVRRR